MNFLVTPGRRFWHGISLLWLSGTSFSLLVTSFRSVRACLRPAPTSLFETEYRNSNLEFQMRFSGGCSAQKATRHARIAIGDDHRVDRAIAVEPWSINSRFTRKHHACSDVCLIAGRQPRRLVTLNSHAVPDAVSDEFPEACLAQRRSALRSPTSTSCRDRAERHAASLRLPRRGSGAVRSTSIPPKTSHRFPRDSRHTCANSSNQRFAALWLAFDR